MFQYQPNDQDTQQNLTPAAAERLEAFVAACHAGAYPVFSHSFGLSPDTEAVVAQWQQGFEHIIVCGMGGASLGARLIQHFADSTGTVCPRFHFVDYLAPCAFNTLSQQLPMEKVGVVLISKSGGTLETLAQADVMAGFLRQHQLELAAHMLVITGAAASPLRQFAEKHGVPSLTHHADVGGRYSIVAEVGMVPALLAGLDIAQLQAGYRKALDAFLADPTHSAPAQGARWHAAAQQAGKTISVLYNYSQRMRVLPAWFEQLWAESLGKNGVGTTPLGANGPGSQHSIQQLFLDGPSDKTFTLILPESNGWGTPLAGHTSVDVLASLPPGTLQQAMGEGTVSALQARGHPVRVCRLSKVNSTILGELLMHFMLETVVTACIWQVNPFDQPAVQESKDAANIALAQLHLTAAA